VRKARSDEAAALGRVLARAFDDDPVMRWMFARDDRRSAALARFFSIRVLQLIDQEQIYTTDGVTGGALWTLPDRWRINAREVFGLSPIMPALGLRLVRTLRGLSIVEHRHPEDPHFYLATLGTDPAHQGEGIGSALMEPVLSICDQEGLGAYLESSKESNIAFYARHGFRVSEEVRMPHGPPVWLMWREPGR
jgi:ribosomal protein S18 acetylase RimI-like enzyme